MRVICVPAALAASLLLGGAAAAGPASSLGLGDQVARPADTAVHLVQDREGRRDRGPALRSLSGDRGDRIGGDRRLSPIVRDNTLRNDHRVMRRRFERDRFHVRDSDRDRFRTSVSVGVSAPWYGYSTYSAPYYGSAFYAEPYTYGSSQTYYGTPYGSPYISDYTQPYYGTSYYGTSSYYGYPMSTYCSPYRSYGLYYGMTYC
jgi:hypothetical protein